MEPSDLEAKLRQHSPALAGPAEILAREERSGGTVYLVSATHLVPVDDDDPSLRDVFVPDPVTGEVEIDRKGEATRVSVGDVDAGTTREVRAYARSLIANGAVRGLAATTRTRRGPGPPARATHEVQTDPAGRKVIRRVGFDVSGAKRSS